jgi:phosphoglycerol transferase
MFLRVTRCAKRHVRVNDTELTVTDGDVAAVLDSDNRGRGFRGRLARAARPLPTSWEGALTLKISGRECVADLAGLTLFVGAVVAAWVQPWNTSLRVPLRYRGDGLFYSMNVKTVIETGWFQQTDRLGAPFGQDLFDYPLGGDNGNYLIIKFLALFSGDFGLVHNAFYLLGFWTAAWAAYFCARVLGTSRYAAIAVAMLYAFTPFHLIRVGHVMLAHYAVVPIGVVLAVRTATGRSFVRPDGQRWHALIWIAACIAIGSFGAYYFVFTLITIAFVALVSAIVNRSTRPVSASAKFGGLIVVVMILNQLGSLLYQRRNGPNPNVADHSPLDFDTYSFRLIQSLTPVPGTRIPLLDDATAVLDEGFPSEDSMYFGLVGAICLVAMLVWVVLRIVSPRFSMDSPPVMNLFVACAGLWILIATTGGLSWFVLLADFDRIRSWSRASIVIVFVVLVWGARQITDLVAHRIGDRPISTWTKLGAVMLVCAIGLADQLTPEVSPTVDDGAERYSIDRDFFTQVEADLPVGALVAQLPIISFPEARLNDSAPYDPLRGFLHTTALRFSYGGLRGRESDWQENLVDASTTESIDAFIAFGFEALVVDRGGYLDGANQLLIELEEITGQDALISVDGKWLYVPIDRSLSDLTDDELTALRSNLVTARPT